ncbi:CHAD domain-containing protein [Sphingomonas sp.]|uniref:CYTH and CHAD domain-containing protein n=1 Tax=Sphingomonas sp. TaxID=28214 RepID=UPI003B3A8311
MTTGDLELELKLEAEPAALDGLAHAALLADAGLTARHEISTYFDTPDQDLHRAGLSLRVRQIGDRFVQTVKAEGSAAAGLFARPEWERELPTGTPQIDDAAGPLSTLIDAALLRTIAPLFVGDMTRATGRLAYDGGDVEIVLDRGKLSGSGRTLAVNEVELELKDGRAQALFDLARALNEIAPLRLGVLSKSERGYRLASGDLPASVKAPPIALTGEVTVAEAFQAVTGACLRHFRLNEDILLRHDGAEPLHQARVALRRLRSALSIFKPALSDARFDHFRDELRWLAATLGDARDLDVLLARQDGRDVGALLPARAQAYAEVHAALASIRTRTLMIDMSEWLAIGGWRMQETRHPVRDRPAESFAAATLQKLRRRLKREGRDLAKLNDEARHEVRILAKKLRYASEFFASLFPGKKPERRARNFLKALEALQTHLGDLNDLVHAPIVYARWGIDLAQDDSSPKRRAKLLRRAKEAHEILCDVKPFWR